jgi:hypothetical protein
MNRTGVVSAMVTVPAESTARTLAINTGAPAPAADPPEPPQQPPAKPKLNLLIVRYAAAVLKGQHYLAGSPERRRELPSICGAKVFRYEFSRRCG